jgi:hypothetical protein
VSYYYHVGGHIQLLHGYAIMCPNVFLREIRYVCNLWPDMYRQDGCGQLDQGIVGNSNGRQRATCGLLGVVLATYWATVRHNADKVRTSQKVKSIMANEARKD